MPDQNQGMRFPALTVAVTTVTAAVNIVQLSVPGVLERLERTPALLHGEWWRAVTSLFVQDSGVPGTVTNLLFLVLLGTIAEQVVGRPWWLLQYFGVGIASEFLGTVWQPVGGGNSIAICGLAGVVALALWRRDARLPAWAPAVTTLWSGAMLSTAWLPLIFVGIAAAAVMQQRAWAVRPAGVAVLAVGVVLSALTNIHGGALLIGVVVALGTTRVAKR
jgi:membrane associated rhomboid family serine protease